MDNDLMARRLRPPSQPTPTVSQQPSEPPPPWPDPLAGGQFGSPDEQLVPQDPQIAPPDGQWRPDPQARADIPWDRPDPEPWPPAGEDAPDFPQIWSSQGVESAAPSSHPEWPAADALAGEAAPPWDRPAPTDVEPSQDPYDAMAPVVSDVTQAPAEAWASWNGNGQDAAQDGPEPMEVAAHNDGPLESDAARTASWSEPTTTPTSSSALGGGSVGDPDPVPDWPAEDDLTVAPPTIQGPVMPEDSWPVTPPAAPSDAPAADPAPLSTHERESEPEPEPAPEPAAAVAPQPTSPEPATAAVTAVVMPPGATTQNLVLRIEVAIVDENRRDNVAYAAKRLLLDADGRHTEYEPPIRDSRGPMTWPEYLWDTPPEAPDEPQQRRPHQAAPADVQPPLPARPVSPPSSAWYPAAPLPPEPMTIDWDVPAVGAPQPGGDPSVPWSTPGSTQPPYQQAGQAPAPNWALPQSTALYQPPAPQYQPPPPPAHQPPAARQYPPAYPPQAYQPAPAQEYQLAPPRPAWPHAQHVGQLHDPLTGLPAAPNGPPAPYVVPAPYASAPPQVPIQSFQSAPAASSRGRDGQTTAQDDDAQPEGRSPSILTAGLTIGFALLVIVLVLVFIQLMTSLLR